MANVYCLGQRKEVAWLGCVQLLVRNGADVNCHNSTSWSPLMTSVYCRHLTIAQYLLEHKADVHYRKRHDVLYSAMFDFGQVTDGDTAGIAYKPMACIKNRWSARWDTSA
jgi:ankyrin repeat protein